MNNNGINAENRGPASFANQAPSRDRQLTFFPIDATEPWKLLNTARLELDKKKYDKIRECYRDIFDSFLPGLKSTPFYTQVSEQLKAAGLSIGPRSIARLVARANALGIKDFPDPRSRRAVPSSSPMAAKLQTPSGPLRMSQEEHNAFAEVYRELLRTWHSRHKKGGGFFARAAARMQAGGFNRSASQLNAYAQYRRRIGDINFPRIRGSQDIERMQIAAVDRIQALGVMATGLMHEILQPLQVIQTTAEHQESELEKSAVEREKLMEGLQRIIRHATSINKVVQHVRTIARAGEIRAEPVSLRTAIENAQTIFGKQLQSRGIKVHLSGFDGNLPEVLADPIALERVFINLLLNARDAIEEGKSGSGMISMEAREENQTVNCDVTDTGSGIRRENLERIFDPYFTTKEVGKGSGMGLTEVLNLMIQFGGKVTVTSEPDRGTRFRLEFRKHVPNH